MEAPRAVVSALGLEGVDDGRKRKVCLLTLLFFLFLVPPNLLSREILAYHPR